MTSPPGAVPPPVPATRSGRRFNPRWLWLLVLIPLVSALGFGVIVGGGVLFFATADTSEPSPEEQSLIVTAEDLVPWAVDFTPRSEYASITKIRFFDRSFDIEYAYDDPADEAPYLFCSLNYEPKLSDAVGGARLIWETTRLSYKMMADQGTRLETKPDMFAWGDRSHFGTLYMDDLPYGHVLVARKGRLTFFLTVSGLVFEESESLHALLDPVLERVEAFQPK